MNPVTLDSFSLLAAGLLLAINAALSITFRLGLERGLLIATVRMIVQLGAIGFVLKAIFEASSPWLTGALALVMVCAAGHEIWSRQSRGFKGIETFALGAGTLLFIGLLAAPYTVGVVIGNAPWYAPRYLLPILGMILGNALSSVALVLATMTREVTHGAAAIEARLALGAGRLEALREPLRASLTAGLMPMLNAMAVTGIVSLPGMMTGQILAGVDPVEAAKYQIMIMFVIAGSAALAAMCAAFGAVLLVTDARARLRRDRLLQN